MRKKRMAAAVLGLLLLLAGCTGGKEPGELAVVRVASLDGHGGDISAVAFPARVGEKETQLVSGQGETAAEACLALMAEGGTLAFLGHVEHIPVGEELARAGLKDPLSAAVLGDSLRPDACIWVVREGSGADWCRAAGGDEAAQVLTALGTRSGARRQLVAATAAEALDGLLRFGAAVVPALKAEGTETAGYALLQEDGLLGYLEGDSARGLELLLGEACHNTAVCDALTVSVTEVSTLLRPVWEGERLVGLSLRCTLTARCTDRSGWDPAALAKGEEELRVLGEKQLTAALARLKELGNDGGVLRGKLALLSPLGEEALWPRHPEGLPVAIEVQAHIQG